MQAGGDVHTMPHQISVRLDLDVPKMHPDPDLYARKALQCFVFCDGNQHLARGLHRPVGARKLKEKAVARFVKITPFEATCDLIQQASNPPNHGKRGIFIAFSQRRKPANIGNQHAGEAAIVASRPLIAI